MIMLYYLKMLNVVHYIGSEKCMYHYSSFCRYIVRSTSHTAWLLLYRHHGVQQTLSKCLRFVLKLFIKFAIICLKLILGSILGNLDSLLKLKTWLFLSIFCRTYYLISIIWAFFYKLLDLDSKLNEKKSLMLSL